MLETLHLFNTFVSKFICYGFGLLRWPRLSLHNNHLSSFFEATLYISHNRMNYSDGVFNANKSKLYAAFYGSNASDYNVKQFNIFAHFSFL